MYKQDRMDVAAQYIEGRCQGPSQNHPKIWIWGCWNRGNPQFDRENGSSEKWVLEWRSKWTSNHSNMTIMMISISIIRLYRLMFTQCLAEGYKGRTGEQQRAESRWRGVLEYYIKESLTAPGSSYRSMSWTLEQLGEKENRSTGLSDLWMCR